ncbi:hypothetical protein RAS2_16930 [Phycisphaerae bacterium RAS2]|nr:hypothetical protein RAS2_16930 [Phycisphaerae bacterium RAS2]
MGALTITGPTTRSVIRTDGGSVTLSGTVDAEGLAGCTWRNSRGGNGDITPVDGDWTVEDIPLQIGLNVITVTATYNEGETIKARACVTRNFAGAPAAGDRGKLIRPKRRGVRNR